MPKAVDLRGLYRNSFLVLERAGKTKAGQYLYLCVCNCGTFFITRTGCINNNHVKSCGCLNYKKGKNHPNYKHGLSNKNHMRNKEYTRELHDLRKYGLTKEAKQAMIRTQNNQCKICGYGFGQKKGDMKVDHCHSTGRIRGLLCDLCNRGLGMFKDNKQSLQNAIQYLEV